MLYISVYRAHIKQTVSQYFILYCILHLSKHVQVTKRLHKMHSNADPRMNHETFHRAVLIICHVNTWQKSCHIFLHYIYLNYHVMYTFFTYLKKCSQSQKSLEEYFSSPSKCTFSIYIHSWVHIKHPLRKVSFLFVAMEGMPGRDNTLSPYSISFKCCVKHCRFQQIKYVQKQLV